MSPGSVHDRKIRASEAARQAFKARVAVLGAVTLPEAAAEREIDGATLLEWVRRGRSESFFRGPRRAWVARPASLDAELAKWHCTWVDCPAYAFLSVEPEGERLCKQHSPAVPRDGRLTATEFADKHGLDAPSLVQRLEAKQIPGRRVDRGGRPVAWLLVEDEVLQVLEERFRCPWPKGCPRFGVGPSGHCSDHAGAATQIANARGKVRLQCSKCKGVREEFPSQARKGDLCHRCNLESEEFACQRLEAVQAIWAERQAVIEERRAAGLALWSDFDTKPLYLADSSSNGTRVAQLGLEHHDLCLRGLIVRMFVREDVPRFEREWVKGGDGRRRSALLPDHATSRLTARGIPVDWATRQRLRRRPSLRRRTSPGRPPSARHDVWFKAFCEVRSNYASQLSAGQIDHIPSVWAMCREVAEEQLPDEFPRHPERATKRIYTALHRR